MYVFCFTFSLCFFCYKENNLKCFSYCEQHRHISNVNPSKTLRLLRTRIRNSPVSTGAEKSAESPSPPPFLTLSPRVFQDRGYAPHCARQQAVSFTPGRSPTQLLWFLSAGYCTDRNGAPLFLCLDFHFQWTNLSRMEPFPATITL